MSAAFTAPADWTNGGQDLAGANEIVLAYSERRQALRQSAVAALTAGAAAQDKTLWRAIQDWLETNCVNFVDHVSGPLAADSKSFRPFTLATWRAAAGLHADGFRRKVEPGDPFSYGKIGAGDMRGNWCFEDLQKGLAALKWTPAYQKWEDLGGAIMGYKAYGSGVPTQGVDATTRWSADNAGWAAAPWISGGGENEWYWAYTQGAADEQFRTAAKFGCGSIWTGRPAAKELWAWLYHQGVGIIDPELGLTGAGFEKFQEWSEAADASVLTDLVGYYDESPFTKVGAGFAWDVIPVEYQSTYWHSSGGSFFLFKWNFTNA
ncbi:MAG: hypothetical protein PHX05_00055 [Acidobacteriota bacterium]|nr:hypothetical protein [Acidobacteriota bacterium]